MKNNGFYIKVRHYPDSKSVSVWLMRKDGSAHSSWMNGMLPSGAADKMIEELGLPVERCQSKWIRGKVEEQPIKKKSTKLKPIDLQHHNLFDTRSK